MQASTHTHVHIAYETVNSFSFARTRMTHVSDYINTFSYYRGAWDRRTEAASLQREENGTTVRSKRGRRYTPPNRLGYFLLFTPLNYHYYCQSLLLRSHYQRLMDLIDTFSMHPSPSARRGRKREANRVLSDASLPFLFVHQQCTDSFQRLLTFSFCSCAG